MADGEHAATERSSSDDLAHELRNPLTILAARLQLIRRRRQRGEPVPAWLVADLEAMEAATVRLVAMADRIACDRQATTSEPPCQSAPPTRGSNNRHL